jgi:hypothetical protein
MTVIEWLLMLTEQILLIVANIRLMNGRLKKPEDEVRKFKQQLPQP